MSDYPIGKTWGLNEKQWKVILMALAICLIAGIVAIFAVFHHYSNDDVQGVEKTIAKKVEVPLVFSGDFPESLTEERMDVMIIDYYNNNDFDHYIFMKDLNINSLINWQKELPQVNAWFIDKRGDKVDISRDVSFRDGKMVIYFATTKKGQNTSWKYKGGRFIVHLNLFKHGLELEW